MRAARFYGKLRPFNSGTFHLRAFPFLTGPKARTETNPWKGGTPMRNYELVCVIQPDLDENAFNGVLDRVKGWIAESGGNVGKVDVWGRRRLAYEIRKHREGQYVLLNFSLNPAAASELERNLRYQETILRHMLSLVG
jgi:small subunit ribosomal protein S6